MSISSATIFYKTLWPLSQALLVASLGILFGFDIGTIFIHQTYIADFFAAAINKSDVVLGTYILGFTFGVFIAGYVTYGSGRKITLLSSTTIGSLAVFAALVAPNFSVLLCAEFVVGFCFALYFMAAALLNAELLLPRWRNLALMSIPCAVSLGTLISLLSIDKNDNRPIILFAIVLIITLIFLALTLFKLPESPRYLALSGNADAALAVLFKLRHDMGRAARELAEINECCRGEVRGIEFFLQNTTYRHLLIFLSSLAFLFNLGGAVVIPRILIKNLSTALFCPEESACYFSFDSQIVYLTFSIVFVSLILHSLALERWNGRNIVIFSCSLSIVFLFFSIILSLHTSTDLINLLVTISISSYVFFALGAFTTFISLVVQLMPIRGREFGLATIILANGIGILFGLQFDMPLVHRFGLLGFFFICLLTSIFLLYLLRFYLPILERKSLESIEIRISAITSFSKINQNPANKNY